MPPHFGRPPVGGSGTYPWCNRTSPYGSWFLHIMPYIEQGPVYNVVAQDCRQSGWNENHCDSYLPYSTGGVVVDQYNGHDYVYVSTTGGGCVGLPVKRSR